MTSPYGCARHFSVAMTWITAALVWISLVRKAPGAESQKGGAPARNDRRTGGGTSRAFPKLPVARYSVTAGAVKTIQDNLNSLKDTKIPFWGGGGGE
ncbi:hypothetical protein GGR50DRAFT_674525 [Xylaria sp. CBS 124048]|nr:hypothetical protein GGR50DRAFT_674525 [Xylaria sp. CBS 124048]